MRIKGIIFDKDGTLIKFKEFWLAAAMAAAETVLDRLGCPKDAADEMLRAAGAYDGIKGKLCSGTYADISDAFEEIIKKRCPGCAAENIYDLTRDAFDECVKYGKIVPACENIKGVIESLKGKGISLFLVTTDGYGITKKCLDGLGITEYFDGIYTDDGEGKTKPDPYFIYRIEESFGFAPDELLMVGDTVTDIEFAKNGGIAAVGVARADEDKKILEKGAAAVIDDISQLEEILNEI